jgi:hypothetical protein
MSAMCVRYVSVCLAIHRCVDCLALLLGFSTLNDTLLRLRTFIARREAPASAASASAAGAGGGAKNKKRAAPAGAAGAAGAADGGETKKAKKNKSVASVSASSVPAAERDQDIWSHHDKVLPIGTRVSHLFCCLCLLACSLRRTHPVNRLVRCGLGWAVVRWQLWLIRTAFPVSGSKRRFVSTSPPATGTA